MNALLIICGILLFVLGLFVFVTTFYTDNIPLGFTALIFGFLLMVVGLFAVHLPFAGKSADSKYKLMEECKKANGSYQVIKQVHEVNYTVDMYGCVKNK